MDLTRRTLLATGTVLGLTGCLSSGDSNVSYPETATRTPPPTETPADAAMAEAESEPAAVDEEEVQQTEPSVPNRQLATEVGRVYGEIEWFATSYDDAIDTHQRVLGNAMAAVTRVRDAAEFDANSLGLVRGATDRAVRTAEAELGGHFGIPEQMREQIDHHLATTRRFANRGDLDRVDEELERLHDYLAGIRSDLFVRRVLSDRQVDATLYRNLHDGTADSDDSDDDDDDEAAPGLFECYHSTGYAGYAYAGPRYIEREPFGDAPGDDINEGQELLARQRLHFDAVGESTGRNGFAYVVSYAVPEADEQPTDLNPLDYPHTSLFVQHYDGVQAATDAAETLFDTSVSREGTYSFGRDEWHQVYYHADGDVSYAYLIQAGPYVVVAAPSEVAWEERVDWTDPLDRLWLWRP
ncbi:hypothetical protein [Haloplanus aerogenes]|uniref:Uncharacterized protein n=1 Tax=Haloplanus aerogenes TaxID=660522 RepID=A0A3M0D392_9EURY|nr:hypothetical protein [Haloplanus aerogenes]AZH25052.1 hypothetical protein DU502_06545 [Haloplanus aerogenes]RMB13729.1 hypothetical protein ATH50_2169 [Haloplanus aerogenes]